MREDFPNGFIGRGVGGGLQFEEVRALLDDPKTLQVVGPRESGVNRV